MITNAGPRSLGKRGCGGWTTIRHSGNALWYRSSMRTNRSSSRCLRQIPVSTFAESDRESQVDSMVEISAKDPAVK